MFTFDENEIINQKMELPKFKKERGYIYFLIDGDQIVYVGQSTNVSLRIYHHLKSDKVFDYYSVIPCEQNILNEVEAFYIVRFKPKYNHNLPKNVLFVTKDKIKKDYKIDGHRLNKLLSSHNITPVYLHYYEMTDELVSLLGGVLSE